MDFEDLVCRVNLFPCIYCFSKFGIYHFRENGPFWLVSWIFTQNAGKRDFKIIILRPKVVLKGLFCLK